MKDYKAIWNGLSVNFDDASFHVCCIGEEEEIRARGTNTADFLQQVLQITKEDKVLEIGCGVARVGREIAPLCAEWHGTDISGNMLVHAAKRLEGIPNAYLHELPFSDLSIFPANSFDCVYSTIVFMHLDKAEMFSYMRAALRVLVPGGRAYFDTCNILSPESWRQFLVLLDTYGPTERPGHAAQYSTPQEMEKFMQEAGFEQVHVDGDNPQLVVALGKKVEQADYVRGVIDHKPFARDSHGAGNGYDLPAIKPHYNEVAIQALLDEIASLREDVLAKSYYVSSLEQTLAQKERHISRLERTVARDEKYLSSPLGRLTTRVTKPKGK
ncbi:MAG: class I SAM-dependent methyltransferase [Chloroflexota bacterium]